MGTTPEQFDAFVLHVLATPALQHELQRNEDYFDFPQVVMRMGHAEGFSFTEDDVRDAQRNARRVWLQQDLG